MITILIREISFIPHHFLVIVNTRQKITIPLVSVLPLWVLGRCRTAKTASGQFDEGLNRSIPFSKAFCFAEA